MEELKNTEQYVLVSLHRIGQYRWYEQPGLARVPGGCAQTWEALDVAALDSLRKKAFVYIPYDGAYGLTWRGAEAAKEIAARPRSA